MITLEKPVFGVAVDQGSGLEAALREARGADAREDDLLSFKRIVVETLSSEATTLLVDATFGRELLPEFHEGCVKMLAYEADVYHIADEDRITKLPEDLKIADFPALGAQILKFFLYYGPKDAKELNDRKADLVARIGAECRAHGVTFLFEPIVYDRDIPDGNSAEYAQAKPALVEAATRTFADARFNIDILKVEIPVNIAHVGSTMTEEQALAAFRSAAQAAGETPILYLSAGVTFEQFIEALSLARKAEVDALGFMCGRAIWSDAIDVFGAEGPEGMTRWMKSTGRDRLARMKGVMS